MLSPTRPRLYLRFGRRKARRGAYGAACKLVPTRLAGKRGSVASGSWRPTLWLEKTV